MTFAICGELVFPAHNGRPAFRIRRFSEVKIESSWQSLTDTADIVLPRKVKDFDRMKVSEWFREGDPIEIYAGYNGNLSLEFSGYVKQVPAGIPLTITCEDEMYQLKRRAVSVSLEGCSLKELLQHVAPGYSIVCDDTSLGAVRFPKMSSAMILEELAKSGIRCWFVGKTLYAFSVSRSDWVDPVKVLLEKTAGESLKQKAVENTLVIVRLLRKIGKKLTVEYGDKGAGKIITRELSGVERTIDDLEREAKRLYERSKIPGLDGDVTLFGLPSLAHGMKIALRSSIYPEKNGTYRVDAITKTINSGGYRQKCKLGDKEL
ncbi:MAG: hypothetical protein JW783_00340 [Bacteroidales bacterium]|nr:hypothetical protein [Bacteroidales bacterium]MBN2748469.1 hypothetical protein [Bacteroidales bacterium]